MFNDDFYPTPDEVVKKMIDPLSLHSAGRILDPSAGKGNILDFVCEYMYSQGRWHNDGPNPSASKFSAIEIEPDLQAILLAKGYRVIGSDLLAWDEDEIFNTILMNPPFSHDCEHFMKAWNYMVKHGGKVVSILNAESIKNPRTRWEFLAKQVIESHSFHEPVYLSDAFKRAERRTNVEIVIVYVEKKITNDDFDFDVEVESDNFGNFTNEASSPLASADIVESLVHQYELAKRLLYDEYMIARKRFHFCSDVIGANAETALKDYSGELLSIKNAFWKYFFERTKIGQNMPSSFIEKFERYKSMRSNMAFSQNNIMEVVQMFIETQGQIFDDCIVSVFDKATSYHEDNKVHYEGWKTNKCWKCAPKMIIPYGIHCEKRNYNGSHRDSWGIKYENRDFYNDLDIVMSWIAGVKFDKVTRLWDELYRFYEQVGKGHDHQAIQETTFFRFRIYKKGTIHIYFKDLDTLAKFNRAAAKGKMWLGPGE